MRHTDTKQKSDSLKWKFEDMDKQKEYASQARNENKKWR